LTIIGVFMLQVETPPSPSKWQRQHEQTFFRQLSFQRDAKKLNTRASKEKAQKLARKIPTEMLAREWMNDNEVSSCCMQNKLFEDDIFCIDLM